MKLLLDENIPAALGYALEAAGFEVRRVADLTPRAPDDAVLSGARRDAEIVVTAELSDALPASLHMTLPQAWNARRLRVPDGVRLHFADIVDVDRRWSGAVPVTAPLRTIRDCVDDHMAPDLVAQAVGDCVARGLFSPTDAKNLGLST